MHHSQVILDVHVKNDINLTSSFWGIAPGKQMDKTNLIFLFDKVERGNINGKATTL